MNSFSSQLEEFKILYYSDHHKELLEHYQSIKSTLKKRPELVELANSHKEFSLYEEEVQVIQAQTQFLLKHNWKNVVNTEDILIQTSKSPHQFLTRLKFPVRANPMHVFSVLYENDFAGDWMKTMKCSKTLEKFSLYRKKIQNFYKLPWPLTHRHSILHTRYLPIPELRTILIVAYTPKENFLSPVNYDKFIEMVLPSASVWMQCEDERCELNIILQANKYINNIPEWIVNFLISKSLTEMVKDFRSLFNEFEANRYYEALSGQDLLFYKNLAIQMNLKFK